MKEYLPLLMMGVLLAAVSIPNLMGRVWTIRRYNRRRVSEEDIPAYSRTMGVGTLVIGASVVITAVCLMLFDVEALFYLIVAGLVVGLAIIFYAQFKYNGGLF